MTSAPFSTTKKVAFHAPIPAGEAYWWAALIVCILNLGVTSCQFWIVSSARSLDADALYPVMLAQDLFDRSGQFLWSLPPANGFFPDVLIVALMISMGATGAQALCGYFIAFVLLLWLGLFLVLRVSGYGRWPALIAAWITGGPALSALGSATPFVRAIESPNFHQGTLVLVPFILALTLRNLDLEKGRWISILLAGFIALGIFSDRIIIIEFMLPIFFSLLINIESVPGKYAALNRNVVLFLSGSFVGTIAALTLYFCPGIRVAMLAGFQQAGSFAQWARDLRMPAAGWIRGGAAFLSILFLLAFVRPPSAKGKIFFTFVVLSSIASFAAPIFLGLWHNPMGHVNGTIRYQLPSYIFPIAAASCWSVDWLGKYNASRISAWLVLGIGVYCVGGIFQTAASLAQPSLGSIIQPFSQYRALGAVLSSEGYQDVLADYWDAKPLIFAKRQIQVCPLNRITGVYIYRWITNDAWCLKVYRDTANSTALIPVIVGTLGDAPLRKTWQDPVSVERLGDFTVFTYPAARIHAWLNQQICRSASVQCQSF